MTLLLKASSDPSSQLTVVFSAEVGGDEISEVGPKTEDEYHLHPKPKPKITEDQRPKTSYTILYNEATNTSSFEISCVQKKFCFKKWF